MQQEKVLERAKQKRDQLEKVQLIRKRGMNDTDDFDVSVDTHSVDN